jgi:deoxyribodipyrimidine photo-lyase
MKRILVWFRNDLRLHDNLTLSSACADADEVIAYYCFDQRFYKNSNLGFPRTGARRAQFILESLAELKDNLNQLNIPLVVHVGDTTEGINKLSKDYLIDALYSSKEFAAEEVAIEDDLSRTDIILKTFESNQLFNSAQLPFALYKLPKGFTSFRKKVESVIVPAKALPSPVQTKLKSAIESSLLPTLNDLGLQAESIDNRAALAPKGGESEGLNRLNYYLFQRQFISQYKETRNGLIGESYSSKFSFWLANGCLSPRQIFHEVKRYEEQYESNESTYWIYFELLWREFFRLNALKKGAQFFQMSDNSWIDSDDKFETWMNAKTGNSFIDANMLELKLTGFMSNRGRQNVASFLINDLQSDWQKGAAWFESKLIDYDVYSNYGNWTYLAGSGNDPRGQRSFNINSQAERYDPNQDFVKLWLKS